MLSQSKKHTLFQTKLVKTSIPTNVYILAILIGSTSLLFYT